MRRNLVGDADASKRPSGAKAVRLMMRPVVKMTDTPITISVTSANTFQGTMIGR